MTDKDTNRNQETLSNRAAKPGSASDDISREIIGDIDHLKNEIDEHWLDLERQFQKLRDSQNTLQNIEQELRQRVEEKTVELRQTNKTLRHSHKALRLFAWNTVNRLERERSRVSLELHDNVAQGLATIKLFLENKLALMGKEEKIPSLFSIESILEITRDNLNEIRRIINYLRPRMLDEIGLLATTQWYWKQFRNQYSDLDVKLNLTATEADIPSKLKLVLYRIIQQASNNVACCSLATRMDLDLKRENQILKLRIRDNGKGFEPETFHSSQNISQGLSNMKEYAELSGGRFSFIPTQNKGTCIEMTWDLGNHQKFQTI